jgi:cytochrome c oxidase subunit II
LSGLRRTISSLAPGLAPGLALLAACEGPQNMLAPRGPYAERIADLWWMMFALASAVIILVVVLVALALRAGARRRTRGEAPRVNGTVLVWSAGVVLPGLVVFVLVVQTARVGVATHTPDGAAQRPLTVEVIGHQYWWEVRYPDYGVQTANEVYLPVGQPVRLRVSAPDVIHSFWVPQLNGKIDMIPGRTNTIWVRADEAGLFRGQCAEYCGAGHALMAFWVEAMPAVRFAEWVARRQAPPAQPAEAEARLGREVYFEAQCHQCHAVPGAPLPDALGTVGPDLGDFGRRRTIAAGTRPNNPVALATWIADPQRVKPGARMPATHLEGERLQALLAYLQSLR